METYIDWKEEKFQEKLLQIFEIAGTDFYNILSKISTERKMPSLDREKDEKIIGVKPEYPSFQGVDGSRPDIYLETNKGRILLFELKPGADYSDGQLINHDSNMKKWISKESLKNMNLLRERIRTKN